MKAAKYALPILCAVLLAACAVLGALLYNETRQNEIAQATQNMDHYFIAQAEGGRECVFEAVIGSKRYDNPSSFLRYPGISCLPAGGGEMGGEIFERVGRAIDGINAIVRDYAARYPHSAAIDCEITRFDERGVEAEFKGVGVTADGRPEEVSRKVEFAF